LQGLIKGGLAQTAVLWPDIERTYPWVHKAAHILNNHDAADAAMVQRRFDGLVGAMTRHRDCAGSLSDAVEHFCKVTRSYHPGLFHCYSVPDLPRTNNDLEHEFGSQRYHERRASGRKTASPAVVLRGEARLIAAVATRQSPPSGADLGRVDRTRWNELRCRLGQRRQARILRTRFRRNPNAYLAELEQKAYQLNRVYLENRSFSSSGSSWSLTQRRSATS
jgi:hypothetical protein